MSKINVIDVDSPEFVSKVLEICTKIIKKDEFTSSRFVKMPDGWIFDKQTSLEWAPSSTNSMNHAKAQQYCKDLDGRLPTVDELQTILDRTMYNPTCDKSIFKDVKCEYYWTSTKYMGYSNASWCVSFNDGGVDGNFEDSGYCVRPVRASQN